MKTQSECRTVHFLVDLLVLGLLKKISASERLIDPLSCHLCTQSHMHTGKCSCKIPIKHVVIITSS